MSFFVHNISLHSMPGRPRHMFCKLTCMKNVINCFLIICSVCIACNNEVSNSQTTDSTAEESRNVSSRNASITPENSYSDLFFDSSKLESFITQNKLPDSVARRMRSFYNTRNYQYAWFSSDGLTEQALGFWNLRNYDSYSGDSSLKNKTLEKR